MSKICRKQGTTNQGTTFEFIRPLLYGVFINMPAIEETVSSFSDRTGKDKTAQIASLLRAVTCIDLTTLSSDDAECNVYRLCHKAENPIDKNLLDQLGITSEEFHVGAVCVYPAQVKNAVRALKDIKSNVPVAAVAAGFPSAQYHLDTKLEEIKCCIKDGAKEIDIVISRQLVLNGEWEVLYEEVKAMRKACGVKILLKTIIAAGELGSLENIYKASIVCMAAGSDFIKTSTGKESVNATLPIGMTMARAIRAYYDLTGYEVGFKPAGGIRSTKEVLLWQNLMKKELGPKWLHPHLFRIGASGLLNDIEKSIFLCVNGCNPSKHVFTYQ
ncbi:deoxyribose-phosphate aldolase-like [Argiope bruennichi]|uniref:deoxyribose-phosphate aldolase-like n=1 Tax=Argiope bruennichi TaxID=94029 RepID=UPI002493DAA5|nr:deoxyribose-phosphate aldolase-like [Argiope bruennichi]